MRTTAELFRRDASIFRILSPPPKKGTHTPLILLVYTYKKLLFNYTLNLSVKPRKRVFDRSVHVAAPLVRGCLEHIVES